MNRCCFDEAYASISSLVSADLERESLAHYKSLLRETDFVCIKDGWAVNRHNFLIELPPTICCTLLPPLFSNGTLIIAKLYRSGHTQYPWELPGRENLSVLVRARRLVLAWG